MNDLSRLYRETIKQHAAEPVGFRGEIDATHENEADNPLCGDRILIQLKIRDGQVEAAAFDGEACAICTASASLLCENITGQPVEHLLQLHSQLQAALTDSAPGGSTENSEPPELRPLLGVKPFPSRIRCALLPWIAAKNAL